MASHPFLCPSNGPKSDCKMILALDFFSFLRGEKDLRKRLTESLVTLCLVTYGSHVIVAFYVPSNE